MVFKFYYAKEAPISPEISKITKIELQIKKWQPKVCTQLLKVWPISIKGTKLWYNYHGSSQLNLRQKVTENRRRCKPQWRANLKQSKLKTQLKFKLTKIGIYNKAPILKIIGTVNECKIKKNIEDMKTQYEWAKQSWNMRKDKKLWTIIIQCS